MNPLDIIIVLVVLLSMAAGIRRGFIIGLYDVIVAVAGLAFATIAYDTVAALLDPFLNARMAALNLIGFIVAYAVITVPGMGLLRPAVRRFRTLTGIIPGVHPVDRAFGIIPGAVQGVVVAFVLVLAAGFFPTSARAGDWLADSRFGLELYRTGTSRVLQTAGAAGFDPSEFFALTRQAQHGSHILPFEVHSNDLAISSEDEAEMLALVNAERSLVGLPALVADPELAAVARLHAIEMFNEGYFSHDSPNTGTPFDRLSARGVQYRFAGENLAFAPDVEGAHEGLMDSPGHRANIVEPGYRRVGIGAVESTLHGTMYVQVFAD